MNIKDIDLNKIFLKDSEESFKSIYYNDNKLEIKLPSMCCPFGLEEEYSNLICKLQFKNLETDSEMKDFYNFVLNFENKINNLLGSKLKSQLRLSDKYPPLLTCKIIKMKSNIITNVVDKDNNNINIYDLIKKYNYNYKCTVRLDKIWNYNQKYYYKWNLIKIEIYDMRLRK